ncbi:helix-turn-helix transcriptional regulator, partial [candidate division KSB1 bacterium]
TRLEEILLISIWRLKENAYGITIREEVKRAAKKELSFGALYVSLDKLVKKGYAAKKSGAPTAERGGRSKNFYTLSKLGIRALQESNEINEELWKDLSDLLVKL